MPDIRPFAGLTYSVPQAELGRLLCPPYDVISPAQRQQLVSLSEYAFARLILPSDSSSYDTRAKLMKDWINRGILTRRPEPALYVYRQQFTFAGAPYTRTSLIAAVRLSDYSEKLILPHERTHKRARQDRLKLLEATRANLDCVLGLYPDAEGRVQALLAAAVQGRTPILKAQDVSGIGNSVFEITEPDTIKVLQQALAEAQVVIGDGHHRYEMALKHRDFERGRSGSSDPDAPWEFVMMALVAQQDPGLIVLPTHRVAGLAPAFTTVDDFLVALGRFCKLTPVEPQQVENWTTQPRPGAFLVACGTPSRIWLARVKSPEVMRKAAPQREEVWRQLDVALLQELVLKGLLQFADTELLEKVHYVETVEEVYTAVDEEPLTAGFIMGAPDVASILNLARAGAKLPQKSTYIEPKLTSGLLIRD